MRLALSFTAYCQDSDELLEEYDNYEEFEEDYINNHVVDKINKKLPPVSVPASLLKKMPAMPLNLPPKCSKRIPLSD